MRTTKFKKLVHEYKNLVYNQALYSTGNRDDAADITQDVLIKLWNHLDNIESHSVKSWLLTVTRNRCIDASRKKREYSFSEFEDNGVENRIMQMTTEGESDPENCLNKAEAQQRISDAIARLPEKIQTTMILRYIQDETYEAIAKILGIPLNSVKVYLHRGRKLLAQQLKETIQE